MQTSIIMIRNNSYCLNIPVEILNRDKNIPGVHGDALPEFSLVRGDKVTSILRVNNKHEEREFLQSRHNPRSNRLPNTYDHWNTKSN